MDRNNIEAIYPLSPLQQGILFHSTLNPAEDAYFGQICMTLKGQLDRAAFIQAWQSIIARHTILRTAFTTSREGIPVQIVLKAVTLPFQEIDWREQSETEQQNSLERFLKEDRAQRIAFAKAPLIRLALIRVADDVHRLIWSEHHLVLDGWSVQLILSEFLTLYSGLRRGEPTTIAPVRPYRDYVSWLCTQDNAKSESYWRDLLQGFRTPTPIGLTQTNGNALSSESRGEKTISLGAEPASRIQAAGRKLRLTANTLIQGAWAILLSRYSGEHDVVYGATVSGRPAALQGVESIVGPFINTLPVRVKINPEESVLDVLRRMQVQQVNAREFEYTPLVEIQKWSETDSRTQLFESIFVFENYPARKDPGSVELVLADISADESSNYPLAFMVGLGSSLNVKVLYSRKRFEDPDIHQLVTHFTNILESILDDPEQAVGSVTLLSDQERKHILNTSTGTPSKFSRGESIATLFEHQVALYPDRIAVESSESSLTYAQLNAQAGRLARYLCRKDIGLDQIVGIAVDRSEAMIVGLLGILKAGAAYLPLDPAYPRPRLDYIIQDARIRVVITQEKYREVFRAMAVEVVIIDGPWTGYAAEDARPENSLALDNSDNSLAYVLYTSGSTGQPKGVGVEQRSVARLVKNTDYVSFSEDEIFLQFAPLSFDASTFEIWGSLLNGARLVMFPSQLPSLDELAAFIASKGITTLWLTAGLFAKLVHAYPGSLRGVRQLIAGGDVLSISATKKILRDLPHIRLVNGYGPTENTTFTCCYQITSENEIGASVSIGRPISNTQAYVLDPQLQLLPVGAIGEIYAGGEGLARGYWKRPDLTAERFVPNPFATEPGQRLYRTGDKARYRADGNIEFLGRGDNQVKIRGFRIELEEIEAALARHPDVLEPAVVIRDTGSGDKQLVAFVAISVESHATPADLRTFLESQLPGYMVPTLIVREHSLPLTENGKIDRKALLHCVIPAEVEETSSDTEQTEVEKVLAGLWQDLFDLPAIQSKDDFFQLGGHSLLAMQIISRIRDIFQVQMPLSTVFECPNLKDMAGQIECLLRNVSTPQLALQPVVRTEKLALSYAQQQLWFLHQFEPGNTSLNMRPAFRLRGPLNIVAVERSLNRIVATHESLRTTFPDDAGEPVQCIHPEQKIDLEVIDLSRFSEADREAEALSHLQDRALRPYDLAVGPLFRPVLVRINNADHILLLGMHHIISDGHSLNILLQQFSRQYEQETAGGSFVLPKQELQYADYASWQKSWLRGETLNKLVGFWQRRLSGSLPALQLPTKLRPTVRKSVGQTYSLMVPLPVANRVVSLGKSESVTEFMVLLAAFYTLLKVYSGQSDFVVGTDVANRNVSGTENVVGFFVNRLALRTDAAGNPPFRELLARVRKTALEAYAHQELPFERLVEALRIERQPNRAPVFQTALIFRHGRSSAFQLPGLDVETLPIKSGGSSLDLTLAILETSDGLMSTFEYDTELFDPAFISRMAKAFVSILSWTVDQPDLKLKEIEDMLNELDGKEQQEERRKPAAPSLSRLKNIKPKAVRLEGQELVRTSALPQGGSLPLVMEPATGDVDLPAWLQTNRDFVDSKLAEHGAILLHGFADTAAAGFEQVAKAVCSDLYNENGEHPRESVSGNIYTPVFHPPDQKLLWHNENSFNQTWPGKILFCCVLPAAQGGETPIVDSRKVFDAIPSKIRDRFLEKGVMYVRNYGTGLGLDWRTVFRTDNRAEVEARCKDNRLDFEWKPNGGLRTRAIRPAALRHERTGEWSWFNQAQHWHVSCLDPDTREGIASLFQEVDYPRHCYYGDGSPIADADMKTILKIYQPLEVVYRWQRGDIMILDNVLVAHARNAFSGPRKLLVALGDLHAFSEVPVPALQ